MKQSKFILGFFAFVIAFSISSCKDDDDPSSSKSKTELLTQNTWVFKTSVPASDLVSAFYTGAEYQFKKDNTYTSVFFTLPGSGVWEFADSEGKIILDKGDVDFEASYKVKTLNESTLELISTGSNGSELTVQYVKK